MTIRYAESADRALWRRLDGHLPEGEFTRKTEAKQAYVLEEAGEGLAVLRWGLFWDSIPFCNLLFMAEGARRRGYGKALVCQWEREMAALGCGLVMTSTQADEEGQHFWRYMGYRDCGGFVLPFPGYEQPLELIMAKTL